MGRAWEGHVRVVWNVPERIEGKKKAFVIGLFPPLPPTLLPAPS